ncbi:MAG: ribosome silencing factor [Dehalococcoidia bacterium]|nr:ribosome silencing factor [Dehalococcoidia bacterium]
MRRLKTQRPKVKSPKTTSPKLKSPTTRRKKTLTGLDRARAAAEAASDKQASDIMLLDLRQACNFTDYFVICSADSGPQVDAIADGVEQALSVGDTRLHHREGASDSGWVLLDFSDVVVHVFSPEARRYYQLDKVWAEAKTIVRIQ